MSESPDGVKEIEDDEGRIARKVKDRILEARQRIDDAEKELFVNGLGGYPAGSTKHRQMKEHFSDRWGVLVRQYIRAVKPLLASDEIENAEFYRQQVPIYRTKIVPPDGKKDWSRFVTEDIDEIRLMRKMGLKPGVDIPEPRTFKLIGLQDVLDKQQIGEEWHIDLTPNKFGEAAESDHLTINRGIPKEAYEKAVEATDEFLNQSGLGLSLTEGDPNDGFLDL
jgi:hypothetical protein